MKLSLAFGRRVRWGTATISALVLAAGGAVVGLSTAQAASPDAQEASFDAQSGDPGESFSGYVGYVGDQPNASASVDESDEKTEGLGPIASSEGHSPDVPGAPVADAEASEADLAIPAAPSSVEVAAVRSTIDAKGEARVTVMTQARVRLEANLSAAGVRAQRRGIAASLDGLQTALAGTGSQRVFEYRVIPAAVYEINSAGLDALLADPRVVSVTLDRQASGQLDSSTGVVDSDLLNAAGILGNNFEGSTTGAYDVAVIDSGVDGGHSAFTSRIVRQACFVTDLSCPGGTNSFIGAPGGEECTHSSDCDHGTHVGGIAAGSFFTGGHEGVARGARLIAIKVAQDNPNSARWTAFFSSIDSGLQHLINLKNSTNRNLVSVNISIGGGLFSPGGSCNTALPTTNALFGQLQALGVAVVVSAGNDGSNDQMSLPACLSNAFAIGATNDADVPATFTNSSSDLRWWAPGVSITAPVPTGTSTGIKDGTSMSAPHVAGAFALLRECVDGNGIPQSNAAAVADLDATGVNVTRNGVMRKRINVLDAATRNVNNNDFAFPETLPATGPFNDFDFNVCADSEIGEPGPFSVDNSVWWQWTPASTGTATISTEDSGTNITTFDTQLMVYTGNTLNSLTPIAFDDDNGTGLRSLTVFPVNAGTTYRIKVDGFAASNGLLNLHMELGPPPQCFGVPATIVGSINGEVINGTPGVDVIVAGDGNDTINGLDGNDRICAGNGDDTVSGGKGDDFVLGGPGADTIAGDAGNDILVGNAGGGDTNDTGDRLQGGTGNDFLDGWVGDDVLDGGNGADTLIGAAGNDMLRGRLGPDSISGGDGVDTASFVHATGPVTASLTTGTAVGEGSDTIDTVENLLGSAFQNVLTGDGGVNSIMGGTDDDLLDGAAGPDTLTGLAGNDRLFGRGGNDRLFGNGGNDSLAGNAGTDHCDGGPGVDQGATCEVRVSIP